MATVSTTLHYAEPLNSDDREPWFIDALSDPSQVRFGFRKVAVPSVITDLRTSTEQPTLDEAGFALVNAPTGIDQQALADADDAALDRYRAQTADVLTERTGADEVVFFDATVRRTDDGDRAGGEQSAHQRVHVDQSPGAARARAAAHRPGERAPRRFQIVNVWRPLLGPVRNFPLALCDFRSIDPVADLVLTRLDFPPWLRDRENYSVRHAPGHRWHYWDALTPDEAIVFKCYDSASRELARADVGGSGSGDAGLADVAGLCPHTAFVDPDGPTGGHLRTSLELRALLFYN